MVSKSDICKCLENLSEIELSSETDEHFQKSLQKLVNNAPSLNALNHLQLLYKGTSLQNPTSVWQFVCFSLECLLFLKEHFQKQSEESEKLLGIAQQRLVRRLLDKVISAGLVNNLLPGVQPPSQHMTITSQCSLTDFEKYQYLSIVTLGLVDLYHNDTFHGILIPQFLPLILSALCQLTMVPLKKSADTYPQVQRERAVFIKHLDELVNTLYQPMIIKELMLIEGKKEGPKWLKRGVGRLLTRQLHQPRGVLATLQAVTDAANCAAPTLQGHFESIARVITASPDLNNICPQIIELLDSTDAEVVRMAVLCVKTLQNRDSKACDTHLLQPVVNPLTRTTSSEQDLRVCLHRLHKCFAVPASDFWCLPSHLLQAHIHILFQLYCKIYRSASNVRKIIEDLVWCFLSKSDVNLLPSIFACLVYREKTCDILVRTDFEIVFGDDGGVEFTPAEESDQSLEEYGNCLMVLLERRDANGSLGNKLFVTLLEFAAVKKKVDTVDAFERQLVTIKLLAVLSENETVQKSLSKNPEPVVKFLKTMIDNYLADLTREVEVISIVLVVLNVILNDCIYSKNFSWQVFSQLEEPLSQLKSKTENTELRLLAEEAHEVIMTQGAAKSKRKTQYSKERTNAAKTTQKPTTCDAALRDACDPLLPVRGHAIMQLGKLLAAGDKQAKAKKDQILCIFQENLKHEDSFLYLSAIEGLAVATAEFPDTAIFSLTEQFSRTTLTPDTRLKVGEALVRVTKILGELVPVYKTELINAFLSGTRDDDFLVRASSLSNLGELCRVLGFRIGPIVAEVLVCARCMVSGDTSVEVRRAAVLLICLLLKGLHKDALSVLQDVLLELYRSLKQIYASDKDDVTRLHAQLALEELNSGTLAFLFPKPLLTKQIFVLDPPT